MSEDKYQDQIAYFKARLMLVILLMAGVLVGEGLWVWQKYKVSQQGAAIGRTRFRLQRQKFDELWNDLKTKTVPVELEGEIRYGGEVGKLEPFE